MSVIETDVVKEAKDLEAEAEKLEAEAKDLEVKAAPVVEDAEKAVDAAAVAVPQLKPAADVLKDAADVLKDADPVAAKVYAAVKEAETEVPSDESKARTVLKDVCISFKGYIHAFKKGALVDAGEIADELHRLGKAL
jgi:hypothetical protein